MQKTDSTPLRTCLKIAILTISDTRDMRSDTSGTVLERLIKEAGHECLARKVIIDDIHQIRLALLSWCADRSADVVLTTGGTGMTARDGTPEAVSVLFEKRIDGFGELFRMISYDEIGTSALQSRAIAGLCNGVFVFCLPGSTSACKTAWNKLIVHQLDNGTKPCNLVDLIPRIHRT